MKKLLLIPFLALCLEAFACGGYGDLYPKWSIGVIGAGSYSLPNTGFKPFFLPGIQFTHTDYGSFFAQRFALEQVKYSLPEYENQNGNDMMSVSGTERRTLVRIGVEHGWFLLKKFRPYVALDLAGQIYKSDVDYVGGIAGLNQNERTVTRGIGLIPSAGLKFFFGRKICAFAEYRAEAFVNSEYKKVTYKSGNVDTRPVRDTRFDFNGGAIAQVGVQVMF